MTFAFQSRFQLDIAAVESAWSGESDFGVHRVEVCFPYVEVPLQSSGRFSSLLEA